jgi:tRNA(adenine34) deaminase
MDAQRARDERYMARALEQARLALPGDVPIGALVVRAGEVLAAARNEREARRDPTAHAEILALRLAAERLGTWRLKGTTVYVTLEPCPMCAGALVAARVARLVYGPQDPKAGAAYSLYNLCDDPRLNHQVEITAGVLEEPCAELLRAFFEQRRA